VEPGLTDTDPETGRVHLEMLRSASPHQRLRLALSLSGTVMSLARHGIARAQPGASPEEIGLRFVALLYGPQLAEDVKQCLSARRQ